MLSNAKFKEVIRNTNLFAFDLIIKNSKNEILLGKRNNKPAKDMYFVPGGRVYKNENLNDAFDRILKEETTLDNSKIKSLNIKGLFDHMYKENVFENNNFSTHYIVYAIELQLKVNVEIFLDRQHSDYKFLNKEDLLLDDRVHQNVKNYFLDNPTNIFNIK